MQPPLKIFIVDDNEAYRDGLSEYVNELEGVSVVGMAGSGEDALPLINESSPDVVLMDISMPGMNGMLAAREVKIRFPGMKVVFVTVHQEETFRVMGDLIGVDGFVSKNAVKVGLRAVFERIRHLLEPGEDEQKVPRAV